MMKYPTRKIRLDYDYENLKKNFKEIENGKINKMTIRLSIKHLIGQIILLSLTNVSSNCPVYKMKSENQVYIYMDLGSQKFMKRLIKWHLVI